MYYCCLWMSNSSVTNAELLIEHYYFRSPNSHLPASQPYGASYLLLNGLYFLFEVWSKSVCLEWGGFGKKSREKRKRLTMGFSSYLCNNKWVFRNHFLSTNNVRHCIELSLSVIYNIYNLSYFLWELLNIISILCERDGNVHCPVHSFPHFMCI